jgi:IS1 family transposase
VNVLPFDRQVQIVALLMEGCSLRSINRLTKIHRDTISRLVLKYGWACERLHDRMMRNLQVSQIQIDDQWTFVHKKEKRLAASDPREWGENWLFLALASNEKAILSYAIGKRNAETARILSLDLRVRVRNTPQITTDGLAAYVDAIDEAFGENVHFAQLVKNRRGSIHDQAPFIIKVIRSGNPEIGSISTSFIERFNASTRLFQRRFTRRTLAFSKNLANLRATVALWLAYYNFCWVLEHLKKTPAQMLGLTDHEWTISELLTQALADPATPTEEPPKPSPTAPGGPKLRLIMGGKK